MRGRREGEEETGGLDVESKVVGSGGCEIVDPKLGVGDHEVAVEERPTVLAQGLDHGSSDGEVGHEVTVSA